MRVLTESMVIAMVGLTVWVIYVATGQIKYAYGGLVAVGISFLGLLYSIVTYKKNFKDDAEKRYGVFMMCILFMFCVLFSVMSIIEISRL